MFNMIYNEIGPLNISVNTIESVRHYCDANNLHITSKSEDMKLSLPLYQTAGSSMHSRSMNTPGWLARRILRQTLYFRPYGSSSSTPQPEISRARSESLKHAPYPSQ
jgi:hypothetical protein